MDELDKWHEFFVMLGGAEAALTGLVFVALSLHIPRGVETFWMRGARLTSFGLLALLCVAGVALIPTETPALVGVGVLAVNAAWATEYVRAVRAHSTDIRRMLRGPESRFLTRSITAAMLSTGAVVAGAAALVAGTPDGIALVAIGSLGGVAVGVANAWYFLTLRPARADDDGPYSDE